jgi:serine protease Do
MEQAMAVIDIEDAVILGTDVSESLVDLADQTRRSVVLVRSGRYGSGSGIVWSSDGTIITNYHVVAGRTSAQVTFSDDSELRATVIAGDPALDLAVLKVAATGLPAAPVGLSQELRIGQLVMAVGNPWGRRGVATLGIVSALGEVPAPWRKEPSEYIRSDVMLAPGNSGGALLDMRGRVIGINAMIFGGDLSVAIPSDVATQFLSLAERRPMLGVGVRSVRLPFQLASRVGQERALEVVELLADGPAAKAGCVVGDLLLKLGGILIVDAQSLRAALEQHQTGARVALETVHNSTLTVRMLELQGMPKLERAA